MVPRSWGGVVGPWSRKGQSPLNGGSPPHICASTNMHTPVPWATHQPCLIIQPHLSWDTWRRSSLWNYEGMLRMGVSWGFLFLSEADSGETGALFKRCP